MGWVVRGQIRREGEKRIFRDFFRCLSSCAVTSHTYSPIPPPYYSLLPLSPPSLFPFLSPSFIFAATSAISCKFRISHSTTSGSSPAPLVFLSEQWLSLVFFKLNDETSKTFRETHASQLALHGRQFPLHSQRPTRRLIACDEILSFNQSRKKIGRRDATWRRLVVYAVAGATGNLHCTCTYEKKKKRQQQRTQHSDLCWICESVTLLPSCTKTVSTRRKSTMSRFSLSLFRPSAFPCYVRKRGEEWYVRHEWHHSWHYIRVERKVSVWQTPATCHSL